MCPTPATLLKPHFASALGMDRECIKKFGLQKTDEAQPACRCWSFIEGQEHQGESWGMIMGDKRPLRAAVL